ncbi:hypothetical protein [Endozoicomonas atrinae]|uniref:hypothetical protein n=1 Tax=Endozoicomonas atrinae TaxID=1333660 RepID=UPI0008250E2F|nr:hypothetical protein [Endozoicomonas atrinae]
MLNPAGPVEVKKGFVYQAPDRIEKWYRSWLETLVAYGMIAETSTGLMVLNAAKYIVTTTVIAGIILIGLIPYGFNFLMRHLEKKLVPWKGY